MIIRGTNTRCIVSTYEHKHEEMKSHWVFYFPFDAALCADVLSICTLSRVCMCVYALKKCTEKQNRYFAELQEWTNPSLKCSLGIVTVTVGQWSLFDSLSNESIWKYEEKKLYPNGPERNHLRFDFFFFLSISTF